MSAAAGQNRLVADAPSRGRILIVDDNRDFATALCNSLALEGYEVEVAHDGGTARTALERFGAQVILLDLRLEAGSGLDLIAPLKEQYPDLVFILITGYAVEEAESINALRAMNVTGCLVKPFDPVELAQALEEMSREGD